MNNTLTKHNLITIMTQAFYGNRTCTQIRLEELDHFVLGHLDSSITVTDPIDRTIIKFPNTDNLVLIYNKHQEKERLAEIEFFRMKDNYHAKPLATIPELGIVLYSRCIVCRLNEQGELQSLQNDDYKKFIHYLSK